jgi:hypothetical protein
MSFYLAIRKHKQKHHIPYLRDPREMVFHAQRVAMPFQLLFKARTHRKISISMPERFPLSTRNIKELFIEIWVVSLVFKTNHGIFGDPSQNLRRPHRRILHP